METHEHKAAGDQIRIETLYNPYLTGSVQSTHPVPDDHLNVRMMKIVDDIPVPLNLTLTAGDIVALAGDYYTKEGWGKELKIPENTGNPEADNKALFAEPIEYNERQAFLAAYSDLASENVTEEKILKIYGIEERGQIIQQFAYMRNVPKYKAKLENNEAHFTPWSVRAYMVGHQAALESAIMARTCHRLSLGQIQRGDDKNVSAKLQNILKAIDEDVDNKYGFHGLSGAALYSELANRYHAQAIAQDLFIMHFYSDHFAAGHMSRMGVLRQTVPEKFGMPGSILINNMHNEDNDNSVAVANPYQPSKLATASVRPNPAYVAPAGQCSALGDGTYATAQNDENSNWLINGMNNSLGDITRHISDGAMRFLPENYGGFAYLPEIDYRKRQTQPLLIQGVDGKTYVRKDIMNIRVLSPTQYKDTLKSPTTSGYEELTWIKAALIVAETRTPLIGRTPKLVSLSAEDEARISQDEEQYINGAVAQSSCTTTSSSVDEIPAVHPALSALGGKAQSVNVMDTSFVMINDDSVVATPESGELPDVEETQPALR